MKSFKRFLLSMLVCVILAVSLMTSAFAADNAEIITDKNDARISAMLNAIDQQNFETASINAEQAKKYVSHFLYDSGFAAFGGGKFKYPNSGSYVQYVTDGTYSQNISLSKGCMAHSLYMSKVFYGTEANNQKINFKGEYDGAKTPEELKNFLKEHAQAGEHLRVGYNIHSVAFISCDDNGFYAFSYEGGPIRLKYYKYSLFVDEYVNRYQAVTLREANPSLNGSSQSANSTTPQCVHNYNSLGVCDKCGKSYPYTVSKSIFNVTLAAKANAQSKPYGHSAYYKSTLPAGTTVAVAATTKNHYGNTWYQMTDGNWICSDRCKSFSQKVDDKKPAVTISGEVSPSGTLKQGSNFGLRGTITTDCGTITSVTGSILDSSGKAVSGQSRTYAPNAASFNIRTTINNDLIFNNLPAGSYKYYVKAVAKNGNQSGELTISRTFTVGGAEQCSHSYNSLGVCEKCGQSYPYEIKKANFSVTIVDKAYVQSKPYGDSAYYKSTLSDGTEVTVTGTTKNHYGNTWYQMTDGSWISSDRCTTVSQKQTDQKPTITISGEVSPSGTLTLGHNFGLRGIISTDCGVITSVNGYILNSTNTSVNGQKGYYTPNAASVDIRYTLNNDLIFDNLSVGSYTYQVVITAQNGTESSKMTISRPFTVEAEAGVFYKTPTVSVSGEVSPSGTLKQGSNFGLRGVISTDCGKITICRGYILKVMDDGDSRIEQRCEYTPNAASIDIRTTINNNLIFDNLPAGSYKYYVLVVAENGSESTTYYFSRPFNVA